MPPARRKVPFSGKKKKVQMQAKKQRQQGIIPKKNGSDDSDDGVDNLKIRKINKQPTSRSGVNRYNLMFFNESREEIDRQKREARMSLCPVPPEKQEISDNYYPPGLDMPKRPPWDYSMTKEQLDKRENDYFAKYTESIHKLGNVGYYELNLETWRQLWRVIEMSDVLLTLVDIRYPVLMFPPYLYDYITKEKGKEMILVFNKIDLAPPALVIAWREYFKVQYPQLHLLFFTSFPDYNLRKTNENKDENELREFRRRGKLKMAAEGAQKLLEVCEKIVNGEVDLSLWKQKIAEEMDSEYDLDDLERSTDNVTTEKKDTSFYHHEKYKNGVLTIGCIGFPNVGKSSFMNAIIGHKVVSVSRTPGHTKHFQTIFLTKTVCVCDCPGLVFPSTVPKELQILMGAFPVSQVRVPYTSIRFVAERIDLPKILKIQHPDNDENWCPIDICDGWALKRNYMTARTARLDSYRAANSLLRMLVEGRICLFVYPVGWHANKERWEKHPDIEFITWIQARSKKLRDLQGEDHFLSDDEAGGKNSSNENTDDEDEDDDDDDGDEDDDGNDSADSKRKSRGSGKVFSVSNKFNLLEAE